MSASTAFDRMFDSGKVAIYLLSASSLASNAATGAAARRPRSFSTALSRPPFFTNTRSTAQLITIFCEHVYIDGGAYTSYVRSASSHIPACIPGAILHVLLVLRIR